MPQLVDAYTRAAGAPPPDSRSADPPSIAETLAALCARGRAAHPDLALDDLAFVAHLGRCAAPIAGGPAPVHAEDLYLACAAVSGAAAAVERLRREHRPTIAAYLRVIELASASID